MGAANRDLVIVAGRPSMGKTSFAMNLVENAVTHGIAQLLDGGTVRVEAERRQERLLIVVENPRDPDSPDPKGAGIGIRNVRRRLAATYERYRAIADNFDTAVRTDDRMVTGAADLSTRYREALLQALDGGAIAKHGPDQPFVLVPVVAGELRGALDIKPGAVVGTELARRPRALTLGFHGALEAFHIQAEAAFPGNIGGQIDRETVGVVELEGGLAVPQAAAEQVGHHHAPAPMRMATALVSAATGRPVLRSRSASTNLFPERQSDRVATIIEADFVGQ